MSSAWARQVSPAKSSGFAMLLEQTDEVKRDCVLVRGLQDQDRDAMAVLFDRHSASVYGTALRILRNPQEAEDVMQEVFIQLWRNPPDAERTVETLAPLLIVMARNRAITILRGRRPADTGACLLLCSKVDVAHEVHHRLLIERLQTAMLTLPEKYRSLLLLAFGEGLTHVEIADRERLPLGTVKTRLRSALAALRRCSC